MKCFIIIWALVISFHVHAQIDEIKEVLETKPESEETVIWLCDTAFTFYGNNPQLTQQIAELALDKAIEWNFDLAKARANHVIGISYWARDVYDSAISYYLDALKYYEAVDLQRGIALINLNIGTIYDDLGQSERGKPYVLESLDIIRALGDSINLGRGLNNLAVIYSNIGDQDSAIYFFRETMQIRKMINDSIGVARAYNNIADVYLDGNPDIGYSDNLEAYRHLVEAMKYIKEDEDNNLLTTIYANLGKTLFEMNRFDEAEAYLQNGLVLAQEIDSRLSQQLIYGYMRQLSEKKGDFENALHFYKKEVELDNEQRSAEITEKIDLLNIQYETERRDRQLAEFEKQKAIDRGIRNNLITASVSIILIASLLFYSFYQKNKRNKLTSQLKLQKLKEEISAKNKEITSYTMSFLQKNQLMEELKEKIHELRKSSTPDTNMELTRINRIVDNTFRSDEEWKTFQLTFDQMHDGFFRELKNKYPDISNAELKLCALLRMNMNLKESAKVLGIEPDSVKTSRYRLRKKLGLKTEDNLVDFLIKFEEQMKE
ncbi:tetratricopeptide repeat protein [Ekhidna sp. MALMAid0563]|uniref:tetratricopeptide repeat protein n=1 Tax=Ekhidna sp. MALMAid0563 TaxID=3143937 RepID=UPI0032DF964E